MKKIPKIQKFPSGGHFFDQAGQLGLNALRSTIDLPLTTLGLSNVVPDSAYTGLGAEFGSNYSNKVGGSMNKIAPMAANMLVPGSGALISGAQGIASQYNPKVDYDPNAPKQYAMGGVAELGAKYTTKKEDKVLDDDMANPSAKLTAKLKAEIKQKKLDELFNAQEQMKQSKLNKYAEKLGIKLPQGNSQFANQETQKFPYGGLTGQQAYDYDRNQIINENTPSSGEITSYIPLNDLVNAKEYKQPEDMGNFAPSINETDWSDGKVVKNKNIPYGDIAANVIENIPSMIELSKGKKYDKVDYGRINPKLIDYSQSLRDARMQAAINRNQLKTAAGGNAGTYMANLGQIGAQNTANIANIIQSGENVNAGIYNQAQQTNQEYKIKAMQDEAMNKGVAATNYNKALTSITSNPVKAYMDYKKGNMDYKTVLMLNQLSSKYGWDLNDKGDFELAVKALNK